MNIASVLYIVIGIVMCLVGIAFMAQMKLTDTEVKLVGGLAALMIGLFQIQLALIAQTRSRIDALGKDNSKDKA